MLFVENNASDPQKVFGEGFTAITMIEQLEQEQEQHRLQQRMTHVGSQDRSITADHNAEEANREVHLASVLPNSSENGRNVILDHVVQFTPRAAIIIDHPQVLDQLSNQGSRAATSSAPPPQKPQEKIKVHLLNPSLLIAACAVGLFLYSLTFKYLKGVAVLYNVRIFFVYLVLNIYIITSQEILTYIKRKMYQFQVKFFGRF